jgi:hypothetical protein
MTLIEVTVELIVIIFQTKMYRSKFQTLKLI